MNKTQEIQFLVKEIQSLLHTLESNFWDVFVSPSNYDMHDDEISETTAYYFNYEEEDKKTFLFHGTRMLYYKICLFLELKDVPLYHKMFTSKFASIINDEKKITKSRGPLYMNEEPSMIIHDDFREFLSAFYEFNFETTRKLETNKLKLILENTISILSKTNTFITNETSIYTPVKWIVEMVFPVSRDLGKARFIGKFTTYHPDILIPEISSAVEYKYIRKGQVIDKYLDQIKTDADNYVGDPEYRFFYAIVFFEDKADLNPEAFKQAVIEKAFPENWLIMAL